MSYYEELQSTINHIDELTEELLLGDDGVTIEKMSDVFRISIPKVDLEQVDNMISQLDVGEFIKKFLALLVSNAKKIPTVISDRNYHDSYGTLNYNLSIEKSDGSDEFTNKLIADLKIKLLDESVDYFSSLKQNSKEFKKIKSDLFYDEEEFYQAKFILNQRWKNYFISNKQEVFKTEFDNIQFHTEDFESNYYVIKNDNKMRLSMPKIKFNFLEYASKISNVKYDYQSSKRMNLINIEKMKLKFIENNKLRTIDTRRIIFNNQLEFNNFLTVLKNQSDDNKDHINLSFNPSLSLHTYNKLTHNIDLYFLFERYWENHVHFNKNFITHLKDRIDEELLEDSKEITYTPDFNPSSMKLLDEHFHLSAASYSQNLGSKYYLINNVEDEEWYADLNVWKTLNNVMEILSLYIKESIMQNINLMGDKNIETVVHQIIYKGLKDINPYSDILEDLDYYKPFITSDNPNYIFYATLHQKVYSYTNDR